MRIKEFIDKIVPCIRSQKKCSRNAMPNHLIDDPIKQGSTVWVILDWEFEGTIRNQSLRPSHRHFVSARAAPYPLLRSKWRHLALWHHGLRCGNTLIDVFAGAEIDGTAAAGEVIGEELQFAVEEGLAVAASRSAAGGSPPGSRMPRRRRSPRPRRRRRPPPASGCPRRSRRPCRSPAGTAAGTFRPLP